MNACKLNIFVHFQVEIFWRSVYCLFTRYFLWYISIADVCVWLKDFNISQKFQNRKQFFFSHRKLNFLNKLFERRKYKKTSIKHPSELSVKYPEWNFYFHKAIFLFFAAKSISDICEGENFFEKNLTVHSETKRKVSHR